jgi:hypothetical protein
MNAPAQLGPRSYAGKVAIRHAIQAARENGLDVAGFEVTPGGTIRVIEARALTSASQDDVFERELAKGHI